MARYMLKTRPQQKSRDEGEQEHRDEPLAAVQPTRVRSLLPGLLRIYLPNYSPHDVEISPGIQRLADKYTEMALETS